MSFLDALSLAVTASWNESTSQVLFVFLNRRDAVQRGATQRGVAMSSRLVRGVHGRYPIFRLRGRENKRADFAIGDGPGMIAVGPDPHCCQG